MVHVCFSELMMLLLLHKLTLCAISILMRVDKQSIDGVLHGTETLEQNYVLLHTWTRRRFRFFCRERNRWDLNGDKPLNYLCIY